MKKTESKRKASATLKGNDSQITNSLFKDVSLLIEQSRQLVARSVNAEITMLYWRIGNRIRQYILKEKRADYGQKVVFSHKVGKRIRQRICREEPPQNDPVCRGIS